MPPQRSFAVLISAWCGLREGELFALRKSDLAIVRNDQNQITAATVFVRRSVVRSEQPDGTVLAHEDDPKSDAGIRRANASKGSGFYRARTTIGQPLLKWHALRHHAVTRAVYAGATQADCSNATATPPSLVQPSTNTPAKDETARLPGACRCSQTVEVG